MSYELVWQPISGTWSVWSTVVDDFIYKNLRTPEEVAEKILDNKEYYFTTDHEGNRIVAVAQFRSRQSIIDYFQRALADIKEIRVRVLGEHGWEEEVIPADQVKRNLEKAYKYDLEKWDSGEIQPNPEAKTVLRKEWIEEAERVRREGRVAISGTTFRITPEGLEKGEHFIRRAESLLPPGESSENKGYKPSPWR